MKKLLLILLCACSVSGCMATIGAGRAEITAGCMRPAAPRTIYLTPARPRYAYIRPAPAPFAPKAPRPHRPGRFF